MDKYIVVVEPVSTGQFYIDDIIARGYKAIGIFDQVGVSEKENPEYFLPAHKYIEERALIINYTGDYESLLATISSYPVAAVVIGHDAGVRLGDRLAKDLHLQGNDPNTSSCRINKADMQQALVKAGIRSIRGKVVKSKEEAIEFFKELSVKRVVLKPLESSGTDGIYFCESLQEVEQRWELTANRRIDVYGHKLDHILMQEYIDGRECVVNTVSCNGKHYVTDIWDSLNDTEAHEGNPYDYMLLHKTPQPGHVALVSYAYQMLTALGIQYGPAHSEFMIDEKGPVLLETGARPMGGSLSPQILDGVMGHHILDISLDAYVNPAAFLERTKKPYQLNGCLMLKWLIAPERQRVTSYPLLALLPLLESVRDVRVTDYAKAESISKTTCIFNIPAWVFMYADDQPAIMRDYQFIRWMERHCFKLLISDYEAAKHEISQADVINSLPEHLKASEDVFITPFSVGMEACIQAFVSFCRSKTKGTKIYVAPTVVKSHELGQTAFELLMELLNVRIDIPCHQEKYILSGVIL